MRADPSVTIPTSDSPAESWVNWHKSLLRWFSKQEANREWLRFWAQRAGAGTKADTHDLRAYMQSQGVELTTTALGEFRDGAADFADWFGDTFTGIRNILFGAVIIAIGLVAFYFITNIRKGKQMSDMAADMRSLKRPKIGRGTTVTPLGSQKLLR